MFACIRILKELVVGQRVRKVDGLKCLPEAPAEDENHLANTLHIAVATTNTIFDKRFELSRPLKQLGIINLLFLLTPFVSAKPD